jgi:hypothetical protein
MLAMAAKRPAPAAAVGPAAAAAAVGGGGGVSSPSTLISLSSLSSSSLSASLCLCSEPDFRLRDLKPPCCTLTLAVGASRPLADLHTVTHRKKDSIEEG